MGTYTFQNAVDLVAPHVKNMPLSAVSTTLCDQVNSIIHVAYPWRWTLADLIPIAMSDGVQDYSIADSNFLRLVEAKVVRTDLTPDEYRELVIVENLAVELSNKGGLEEIRRCSPLYNNKIRLERAAAIASPVTLQIQGTIQTTPTKVTSLSSTVPFPDQHFITFTEGLLWRVYKYADDSRAGTVQMARNGNPIYTGQMGAFFALLQGMMIAEDTLNGEPMEIPNEPSFGSFSIGNSGLFGLYF